MNSETQAGPISLSEAAARFEISPQTLRRLCDSGQLVCERDARGWRVQPKEVESYLLARRPAGRPALGLWLQGPAPNPNRRDGVGWLFKAAGRGGTQMFITIWFSSELVTVLQREDFDVRDLVVRGAERLVADALLESGGDLTPGQEILYGVADRSFILRSAGVGEETSLPGDAPAEEGVTVRYELTPRDFAQDGVWPGDTLPAAKGYRDVVVDTRSEGTVRRVRAVRLASDDDLGTRQQAITRALRAYETRCLRLGLPLGAWVSEIATRSNALALSQQRVLDLTYQTWRETNDWPLYTYVEGVLEHEYDLVLKDILATFPAGYLWGLTQYPSHMARLQLTVAGLAQCEDVSLDTNLFVVILGYLVQRRREFAPTLPTQQEYPTVSSHEVRDNVPKALLSPPGSVERLYDLIIQDPYVHQGGGKGADGSWTINVAPEIRRYRGVHTIEDYMARRNPGATIADQAPLRPPRHVDAAPVGPPAVVTPDAPEDEAASDEGNGEDADIFVLMPFAREFDTVWDAINGTTLGLAVSCIRADSITKPGRITEQIIKAIQAASVIIADISGNNANVMFELGYADALGKPVIVLNQDIAGAPFDLRDWRQIEYSSAALPAMQEKLAEFIKTTLVAPRYKLEPMAAPDGPHTPELRFEVERHGECIALKVTNEGPRADFEAQVVEIGGAEYPGNHHYPWSVPWEDGGPRVEILRGQTRSMTLVELRRDLAEKMWGGHHHGGPFVFPVAGGGERHETCALAANNAEEFGLLRLCVRVAIYRVDPGGRRDVTVQVTWAGEPVIREGGSCEPVGADAVRRYRQTRHELIENLKEQIWDELAAPRFQKIKLSPAEQHAITDLLYNHGLGSLPSSFQLAVGPIQEEDGSQGWRLRPTDQFRAHLANIRFDIVANGDDQTLTLVANTLEQELLPLVRTPPWQQRFQAAHVGPIPAAQLQDTAPGRRQRSTIYPPVEYQIDALRQITDHLRRSQVSRITLFDLSQLLAKLQLRDRVNPVFEPLFLDAVAEGINALIKGGEMRQDPDDNSLLLLGETA